MSLDVPSDSGHFLMPHTAPNGVSHSRSIPGHTQSVTDYGPFRLGQISIFPDRNVIEGPLGDCHLEPKTMALLMQLVVRANEVVAREDLLDSVWSDVVVSDQALTRCLSELRKKLSQSASGIDFIKTVPKKGYRLIVSPVPFSTIDPSVAQAEAEVLRDAAGLVDRLLQVVTDSIVVVPLQMLSADKAGAFLGVGFSRDLTQLLSLIPGLGVTASSSVEYHAKGIKDPVELAKTLAASYVVAGAIEYRGATFRLRVELLDTLTGKQLWANRYDDEIANYFSVQDELVEQIGRSLSAALAHVKAQGILSRGAFDLSVYERIQLTEDARRNYSREAAEFIVENLAAVLVAQPDNGIAHALLAMQLSQNFVSGWCADADATRQQAVAHLRHALRLAPTDSRVLMAAGIAALMRGEHKEAMLTLQRSIEKNPNEAHALAEYGTARFFVTRELDPTIALIEQAEQAAPQHPRFSIWAYRRGICCYEVGRYTDAIDAMDEGIARTPNYHHIYLTKALVLIAMDALSEAAAAIAEGVHHAPGLAPEDFINGVRTFGLTLSDDQIERFQVLWNTV